MPRMIAYAGIDEAGYGPLMGPLCVACSVWVIEDEEKPHEPPNLWRALSNAVCKSPRDRRGRIAITDSKRLKGANDGPRHPLTHLERGVHATLGTIHAGSEPASTDSHLFAQLMVPPLDQHAPWYAGAHTAPVANDAQRLALLRAMLSRACERSRARPTSLQCAAVDAREINTAASIGAAKSSVSWSLVMGHARAAKLAHWEVPLRIAIDRQGGRVRYREDLMREFDGARLSVLNESPEESIYALEGLGAPFTISFSVEAESKHLPVALASMTAKYTRELWMRRLNRWFAGRVDGLAPTAGYVEDGRRFLASVRGTLVADELEEALLVRAI